MSDLSCDAVNEPTPINPGTTDDTLCRYTFDGTDTDGTEWYLCTVHDELAIGDETACASNPGDEDGRHYVDPDHVTVGRPEPFTGETWLLFDAEDDEEASHEANVDRHVDGDRYVVGWSHTAVGLVTERAFDTLEDAHAWLEKAGYRDFTS